MVEIRYVNKKENNNKNISFYSKFQSISKPSVNNANYIIG